MDYEGRLRKQDYAVVPVTLTPVQRLVRRNHYAQGGSNTAVYLHGLIARSDPVTLLGAAWWLPPTQLAAAASWDGDFHLVLSLSRFVIVPGVPRNAASFLLQRAVRLIRQDGRFQCLVTYADEAAGHDGTMYRACGWEYMGLTDAQPRWVDKDGRQISRRATRSRDCG